MTSSSSHTTCSSVSYNILGPEDILRSDVFVAPIMGAVPYPDADGVELDVTLDRLAW